MTEIEVERFNSEKAAALLSVLGNSKRLQILIIVTRTETSVGRLAQMTDLSQSALSQHLAKLREHNLVQTRRDAQTIYYKCNASSVFAILEVLETLFADRLIGLSIPDRPASMDSIT